MTKAWGFFLRRMSVLLLVMLALVSPARDGMAALPVAVDGDKLPTLAPMLKKVMPAVVNISTRTVIEVREHPLFSDPFFRRFFKQPQRRRQRESQGLGSGVIIDAERGHIITNHHVIDKADEITVQLYDGRVLNAALVGSDPETDVAVIKVDPEGLVALPIADSDKLQVGDFVVAIGSPFGLRQTVTSGIVSALGRSGLGIEGFEDFIQTDASINPGNSGGALVNLRGELVGINTAILSRGGGNVGIGFAIPVKMAQKIIEQLVNYGKVDRGQLGGIVQDLTPELAAAFGMEGDRVRGAVVVEIVKHSPAEHAGMKLGDIVTRINDEAVATATDVRNQIGLLRVGEPVSIEVIRERRRIVLHTEIVGPTEVNVQVGSLSARLSGAELGNIHRDSPLYGKLQGVVVRQVERGSSAEKTGLRKGDVILTVNKVRVTNTSEMLQALQNGSPQLMLGIRRGRANVTILVR